ncbi:hypothetical protein PHAVU_004G153028 [Phaseolus vulgaris]
MFGSKMAMKYCRAYIFLVLQNFPSEYPTILLFTDSLRWALYQSMDVWFTMGSNFSLAI